MRNLFFLKVLILSLALLSLTNGLFLPSAGAIAPLEGSFTTTIVSNDQVWHGEIKASVTMQLGDFAGNMPFIDWPNATNSCVARYSYFLGTNQTVIYNCVSPTYTDLATRRTSANFILVDGYARIAPVGGFGPDTFTQRTPTVLASAIAALGTNGDYSLSANGGQITYTRIAPETDPNGSNISPVQLSHGASYLSRVSSRTGYPARPDLYSTVDFTPANVGSGETYEMSIGTLSKDVFGVFNLVYTQVYTATGTTVAEVTSRLVAAYTADPSPYGITCVDNTTKLTCASPNDHNVAVSGSSRVIYSTPDTIAPSVTLNGVNPDTIAYGDTYNDPGANWSDNRDGSGMILSTSGSVNTSALGAYTLEYTKIDAGGNTGSITRTVNVRDVTPPVVTLLGTGALTVERGAAYTDSGATWTDDAEGSGSLILANASGSINLNATGSYLIEYSKTDASGNISNTVSRTITVEDTTPPALTITTQSGSINASSYPIRGTTTGDASSVTISGGSGAIVHATLTGSGAFSALVPLTANSANTLIVTASDASGNSASGSVVITTISGVGSSFSGALVMGSGSTLGDVSSTSGTGGITSTTLITLQTPVSFAGSGSGSRVTLPADTTIRTASGTAFNGSSIGAFTGAALTLASNEASNGTFSFGLANTSLHFSKPIKIEIPLSNYTGNSILIKVQHAWESSPGTVGLTNNPNSTCTNGVAGSPSDTASVVNSVATIYTCSASTFVGYSAATVVSSGGGGGGGGGAPLPASASSLITPVSTTTPTLSPTVSGGLYTIVSVESKVKSKRSFTIEVIPSSGSLFTRPTLISVSTVLPEGSRVRITYLREDGKKGVTITRKVTNSTISWKTKKAGKYQITRVLK